MPGTLRRGSRGPDVIRLQSLLNSRRRPSPNLRPDGDFGARTEAAVRNYQTQAGVSPDGVVGQNTWAALDAPAGAGPHVSSPSPDAQTEPPWMAIARQEIGQREIPGVQHNPRIIEYHATTTLKATSDETAWCSSFVNWCLRQAGLPGTNSAAAASWLNWGQASEARAGAVAVIYNAAAAHSSLSTSGNHVGFLVEETTSHYVILGGNQSNQVKVSSFPTARWRLKGYRWPRQ